MDLEREVSEAIAKADLEHAQRTRRWEKKHGPVSTLAVLYLMEKPHAIARGRLTAQRAEKIEHMLAWSFSDYTVEEIEAVLEALLQLGRMREIDEQLERTVDPTGYWTRRQPRRD